MRNQTVAEYWQSRENSTPHADEFASWRRARSPHWCGQCRSYTILPSDRYFDTGVNVGRSNARICEQCANAPLVLDENGAAITANLVDQEREDLEEPR